MTVEVNTNTGEYDVLVDGVPWLSEGFQAFYSNSTWYFHFFFFSLFFTFSLLVLFIIYIFWIQNKYLLIVFIINNVGTPMDWGTCHWNWWPQNKALDMMLCWDIFFIFCLFFFFLFLSCSFSRLFSFSFLFLFWWNRSDYSVVSLTWMAGDYPVVTDVSLILYS